jgi:Xaa-Pro aminopeptidase
MTEQASVWSEDRLEALRKEMTSQSLDGYIVPRFDAHQGEYVAPHDERLAWLSGFQGSAGVALITQDDAILFVDGRYTVQVRNQTSPDHFSYSHLVEAPLEQWLAKNGQSGWTVGFDAMLLPTSWVQRFEAGCDQAGVTLSAVKGNLVDRIWANQPSKPMADIYSFPEQFAGRASSDKKDEIAASLKDKGCNWLVETQPDAIAWLLNVRGGDVAYSPMPHSFFLLNESGEGHWFVDSQKLPEDLSELRLNGVALKESDQFLSSIEELVGNDERVLIDPDYAPYAAFAAVERAGGQVSLERGPVAFAKAIKNPTERAGIAEAAKIDSAAWIRTLRWLDEETVARANSGNPITEMEVSDRILAERQAIEGFLEPSFTTIAAVDANGAMCHYSVTEESNGKLMETSVFLLDSGGQYFLGTTDATRTVCFSDVSDEVKKAYTLVLKGHIQFAKLKFPAGTKGHHIDAIARQPLWQYGMDYDHGTGHGVGHFLSVHEGPQKIEKPSRPVGLEAGMIVTNEPGYYEAGKFGIRIENLIEIVSEPNGFLGFKDLTMVPIQTRMIEPSLLSSDEIAWLDDYHEQVAREMESCLSEEEILWLQKQTRPLKEQNSTD